MCRPRYLPRRNPDRYGVTADLCAAYAACHHHGPCHRIRGDATVISETVTLHLLNCPQRSGVGAARVRDLLRIHADRRYHRGRSRPPAPMQTSLRYVRAGWCTQGDRWIGGAVHFV